MAGFTYQGSLSRASQWKSFGYSMLAKLKRTANGATMKMNHMPVNGVTIMVQCNPDTVHIKAGGIKLMLVDLSTNTKYFATRAKDENGNDYVKFTETNVLMGDRISWSNGKDLACSATPSISAVVISGLEYYIPDPTGAGDQITAICAFSGNSGAVVIRSNSQGLGSTYQFHVVVFGKSEFFGDNPTEEGIRSRIVYSTAVGVYWEGVIFTRNATKKRIEWVAVEASSGLKSYSATLVGSETYVIDSTWLYQSSPPVETEGNVRPGGGGTLGEYSLEDEIQTVTAYDWATEGDYKDSTTGTIYLTKFLCDTNDRITVPFLYGKNTKSTIYHRTGSGMTYDMGEGVLNGDTTENAKSTENNYFLCSLFNTGEVLGVEQEIHTTERNEYHAYNGNIVDYYVDKSSVSTDTTSQKGTWEPTKTLQVYFADGNVNFTRKTTTTYTNYDVSATSDNDGTPLTYEDTRTLSETQELVVNGVVVYDENSPTTSTTLTRSLGTAFPMDHLDFVAEVRLNSGEYYSPTPWSTTTTVDSDLSTPALGDTYIYSEDLYAVRWLSSYGSGNALHPNKIFFLPVDNGVVQPRIIGEYSYHPILNQSWGVRLAIHSE